MITHAFAMATGRNRIAIAVGLQLSCMSAC